ncbi:MAG: BON domain-containing protein [Acidobacteria bacterium]|nr:MAG: BON domain-containing protein [Acidobacteriota bacterium]
MVKRDDIELRRKVLEELDWDPSFDAAAIGVTVKDGIVTLSGFVKSYPEKRNAESAVRRVAGVRAVAEDLTVKLSDETVRTDADVAKAILVALGSNISIPADRIQVTVEDGWVTLDGEVEWQFQKNTAENAMKYVRGVRALNNRIKIKPRASTTEVKSKIQAALARRAQAEANRITVEAAGEKIVLRGTVHSWAEKEAVESAAWSAPGVSRVENDLSVSYAEA